MLQWERRAAEAKKSTVAGGSQQNAQTQTSYLDYLTSANGQWSDKEQTLVYNSLSTAGLNENSTYTDVMVASGEFSDQRQTLTYLGGDPVDPSSAKGYSAMTQEEAKQHEELLALKGRIGKERFANYQAGRRAGHANTLRVFFAQTIDAGRSLLTGSQGVLDDDADRFHNAGESIEYISGYRDAWGQVSNGIALADLAVLGVGGVKAGPQLVSGGFRRLKGFFKNADNLVDSADAVSDIAKVGDDVVREAIESQGNSVYSGVDKWEPEILHRGEYVYGGQPGQTGFYMNGDDLVSFGNDAEKIFESVQVQKNIRFGYRRGLTKYRVTEDITVATSKALNNPQFGSGGTTQYFISNYESCLEPIGTLLLKNFK